QSRSSIALDMGSGSPSAILAATQKVGLGAWAEHIFATLRVTLMGYGLSILIGIPPAIALLE
ncbi:hypothetical protein, partial [Klebsiella variicola]|uniref:hypothetical protein n=1 Tax=Klebsiella variicola TaxID=244366 RepID=UPI001952B5FA